MDSRLVLLNAAAHGTAGVKPNARRGAEMEKSAVASHKLAMSFCTSLLQVLRTRLRNPRTVLQDNDQWMMVPELELELALELEAPSSEQVSHPHYRYLVPGTGSCSFFPSSHWQRRR